MSAALQGPNGHEERCRNGLHPRTPELTYVNPTTGRRACRGCLNDRRRWRRAERDAGREPIAPRVTAAPHPLSEAEVTRLRRLSACHGCGAVRQGYRTPAGERTRIRHASDCPVRGIREDEPRRSVSRRTEGPDSTPGPTAAQ